MNTFIASLCALVITLAFVASVSAAAADTTFCKSPQGWHCNTYSGNQEEVATLKHEEQETTTLSVPNPGVFSKRIQRPFECVSSCDWIRADKYVCDDCVYPFAFYNKTNGYKNQQCITEANKWSVMRDEPAKIETYVKSCQNKGVCKCRTPPTLCNLSCASFYDAVCPLQDNGFLANFWRSVKKLRPNVKFLKCSKYTASKASVRSSPFDGLFRLFGGQQRKTNGVSQKTLNELKKLKIKPFIFAKEAADVNLSFKIKDLNYWCPMDFSEKDKKVRAMQVKATKQILKYHRKKKSTAAKFAPKRILEAIDSFCSYKLDKAHRLFKRKVKIAQKKYAEKKAIEAAKKAAKKAAARLKSKILKGKKHLKQIEKAASKAARKAHAMISRRQRKLNKKLAGKKAGISKPKERFSKRPPITSFEQQIVAAARVRGKRLPTKKPANYPTKKQAKKGKKAKPAKKQAKKFKKFKPATKKQAKKFKPTKQAKKAKPQPKKVKPAKPAKQAKKFKFVKPATQAKPKVQPAKPAPVLPKIAVAKPAPQFQVPVNKKAQQLKKL